MNQTNLARIPFLLILLGLVACGRPVGKAIYSSDQLVIYQYGKHIYHHKSYLPTVRWGPVGCNGMLVIKDGEALLFDSPVGKEAREAIFDFLRQKKAKLVGVVANHFHIDCVDGMDDYYQRGIPTHAYHLTNKLANQDPENPVPLTPFQDTLELMAGDLQVLTFHPGAGHTVDNTVSYVPKEKTLFGGCLVKSLGAGKGNLADADEEAWPVTARHLRTTYPDLRLVIPGHGSPGGIQLLEFTAELFTPQQK